MLTEQIKLGILVSSLRVPAWINSIIMNLADIEYVNCSTLFLISPSNPPRIGIAELLLSKWMSYDSRKHQPNPNAIQSLEYLEDQTDFVKCKVTLLNGDVEFNVNDIEMIRNANYDVLLNLTSWTPEGEILESAVNGIWQFMYGEDSDFRNDLPAGYREVFSKSGFMGMSLVRLLPQSDENQVLYKSYSYADPASLHKVLRFAQWKAVSFPNRLLKDLHQLGPEGFWSRVETEFGNLKFVYQPESPKFHHSAWHMVFTQVKRKLIKNLRSTLESERWILLYSNKKCFTTDFSNFNKIIPPKWRIWADPFIYCKDNKYYLFIEEVLLNKGKKGHISVLELNQDGSYKPAVRVLEKPYHLSYPFLLEWKNELYMIPESSQNRTIDVYKCLSFPHEWEYHMTLMEDIQAVDATFFYYNHRWWLFVNKVDRPGYPNWDELFLFYADEPLTESWTPHPMNPIVSDVRCARPAGKIFEWKGKFYRPSQNCATRYGYGLKINEIVVLNESTYQEKEVSSIEPLWDKSIKTVHTFNFENGLSIIDGILMTNKIL